MNFLIPSYATFLIQQWVDNSSEALKNLKRKKGQQKAQAKAGKSGDQVVSRARCKVGKFCSTISNAQKVGGQYYCDYTL